MRDRPAPDVLTAVLRHIRITTGHLGRIELGAPWGVRVAAHDTVSLHHVLAGEGWLTCGGDEIAVRPGDLVILAHGVPYELRHQPGAPVTDEPARPRPDTLSVRRRYGGPGPRTVLLCADLDVAGAGRASLMRALPPVVHLAGGVPGLDALLDLLRHEVRTARPGADLVVARLTELLLVQGIRTELERPATPGSWRAALADENIARALDAMYTAPERPWTLAGLARTAGLGRTTFAARFRELVGETPIAHLTAWRMALAGDLLRDQPSVTLADIATRVGYADEFAFSTAFHREVGTPPGTYRRSP
ncbi:AraC family transcriptional regulator [Actinoplanes italicus]|uniref:Helix-turn-helix protein n=1 Tax=Actinoplanes italicus TaxID=113567 RepID=A0A2T0JXF7_9ACTN|nr:AraC family transcriptional regulator [Actinoplanes italicus]PRX12688.1 helix-turn-helix protein [Actinoplanes italicus]GIE35457.1 AraC family transcriptional regulator [Actinoplanes italicus]